MARRAELNQPFDVALDRQGNLYFSDAHNHCVRRVDATAGRSPRSPAAGRRDMLVMAEPRPEPSSIHPMASP